MNRPASRTTAASSLPLRGRRDLIAAPVCFRGRRLWSVKDPWSLRYYQLSDEELFILEQVNGEASLADIQQRFATRFAPRILEAQQLQAFLGMLHRAGLIVSSSAGQADQLFERQQRAWWQATRQVLTNPLAIRFRGLDPDPLLRLLYPYVRWMFSRCALFASLGVILAALLSLILHAETFILRLPQPSTYLRFENIVLLAAVLAGCKVFHELGHALTCKHFGGRCHELGVMLLVFTPCLYCNVSDAWMLRSKWQRIAISGAGIYVELVLASICTWLWWLSEPGVWNSIFLHVMLVCSVSTLLFNGNPLLRYDGYFVLADLIEVPNLREQSQACLQQLAAKCLGIESEETTTLPRLDRAGLIVYALAAVVYRWVLVAGILWVVYRALEPQRLAIIAQVLAVFVLGCMLAAPVGQLVRFLQPPHARGRGRGWRIGCVAAAVAAGVVLIGMIPASRHVTAPVVIEAADAVRLRVLVPGTLAQMLDVGRPVEAGDVVATLADAALERQVNALHGERDIQSLYIEQLARLQVLERGSARDGAGSQIGAAKEALAGTQRRLEQKRIDYERLTIKAPRPGILMPDRPKRVEPREGQLATWTGTPLDQRNLGCYLDTDTVICLVGNPAELEGVVLVDQSEIKRVDVGQPVRILVDELHNQILTGSVIEIARVEDEQTPPELLAKRLLPATEASLKIPAYRVRVTLSPGQQMPLLWSSGKAKIAVKPITLAEVIYRELCQTFRIDL